MNPQNTTIYAEHASFGFTNEQTARVASLTHEVAVLREARECVTESATSAQVYGRVNDLIDRRQDEIAGIYRSAHDAAAENAARA